MGRKSLGWYPRAICHITTRGNHRNDMFREDEDYQIYLTILEEALERYRHIVLLLLNDKSCTPDDRDR